MRRAFKPLRVLLALGCFALVNVAFLAPLVAAALCEPGDAFAARIAAWQFWPAMMKLYLPAVAVILAVTLLMGRVYCSTLCPLGVFQDIVIRVKRLFTKKSAGYYAPCPRTRFVILGVCLASALFGALGLAALVEPYSVYGRFATQLVRPALQAAVNAVADWGDAHEHYWLMRDEIVTDCLALWAAAVSMLVVAGLAVWRGRWFCNAICPVGTVLAALSQRPLMKISIDSDKCVKCGLCARACKAGCIDVKNGKVDNARCVRCFNCLGVCKKGAVKL